ncbi:hypothetical protein ACFYPT_28220 [Streptomyces sp. NPDC005529]|uniref:hypothetical protein n=1 Tax=unclassified Streptomyces TaxID=2593676 RepID=UPI0033B7CDCA
MRSVLKPQYEGYYGQLVLSGGDLIEMGELTDVRRAARGPGAASADSPSPEPAGRMAPGGEGV